MPYDVIQDDTAVVLSMLVNGEEESAGRGCLAPRHCECTYVIFLLMSDPDKPRAAAVAILSFLLLQQQRQ